MARYRCRSILTMAYIIMCPGLDRPRTVGPGLAVKLIKPDPLRGPLDFFAAVFARTSFGSASHEKAPPLRGRALSSCAQDWIDRGRSDQVWPWSGSSPIRFADLGTFSRPSSLELRSAQPVTKKPHRFAAGLHHQVPRTGLEPAHRLRHYPLKVACLPISPPGHY